jgi:hypothetical protein
LVEVVERAAALELVGFWFMFIRVAVLARWVYGNG